MADKEKSKKPSPTVLGANLRSWRKAYDLRREDVAEALGISKSAVGHYETGRSEVPDEILYKYSDYFHVPVELLMNGAPFDVKVNIDSTIFLKNIDIFLPIEERTLGNDHYRRACRIHREMYNNAKRGDENAFYRIEDCWDEYEHALEECEGDNAVAANYLALIFLCVLSVLSTAELMEKKIKPAILEKLALKDQKIEELFFEPDIEMQQDLQELVKDIHDPEYSKLVAELLKQLKQSEEWYELADYYIAFQYFFGLVDNCYDRKMNMFIGSEMLDAFANVSNRYAKKVNKLLIEGYR